MKDKLMVVLFLVLISREEVEEELEVVMEVAEAHSGKLELVVVADMVAQEEGFLLVAAVLFLRAEEIIILLEIDTEREGLLLGPNQGQDLVLHLHPRLLQDHVQDLLLN